MKFALALAAAAIAATHLLAQAPLAITSTFPPANVGSAYSLALSASGGTPPYTWSAAGLLPPGLGLTPAGAIHGTPTLAGQFPFTVVVTDSRSASASQSVTMIVSSSSSTAGKLTITTSALAGGKVGQSYSQTLAAAGGTPPYQWMAGQGLPQGIGLDPSNGNLSGIPTSAGTFSFQIQVTDAAGNSASGSFSLAVTPGPLAITTVAPLFSGTVGVAYAQKFSASGGTPPYAWSITSGSTGGLMLDAASGALQGTPQSAATLSFTIAVTDAAGAKASQSFSIIIQAPTLVLATGAPLPSGTAGAAYNQKIAASATGGTPPYTWSASGLPPGLSFDPGSLALSGTPTAAGNFQLALKVADAAGQSASRNVPIVIAPASLTITTVRQLPAASLNTPFSASMIATGGAPPYNWSAVGLPAGLAIDPGSGVISGTPTAAGSFSPVVITVSDSSLNHYSDNFSMAVNLPALPDVTITGLPAAADPAQQYPLTITLASAYPADIAGQAILTFSPDSGPGDSTIAFASGGTMASFQIPAGTTTATADIPLAIQTGTASGVISISLRFQAGGVDITPSTAPSISATIPRAAPVITSTQVSRTSTSIIISVAGYSTSREVTQAVFTFGAASGQTLQTAATSITVDVSSLFAKWFGTSDLGGQFYLTQPFTVQGDPTLVIPVSVTLTNRIGPQTVNINP